MKTNSDKKKDEEKSLDEALKKAIKEGQKELIWGDEIYFIEED